MNQISKLQKPWETSVRKICASDDHLFEFKKQNNLLIPDDLSMFFRTINGTNGDYNDDFFQFNSLSEFKSVKNVFGDWKSSVPDYSMLFKSFINSETCFVFANYQFFMFTYCIQLRQHESGMNEIYILCGDQFKMIASSFTEFVDLYIRNSEKLQF